MSFELLPLELIDAVCDVQSHANLVALARTSSLFYPSAHRALYRHLIATSALVGTLAERPDLASFVHSFSLRTPSSQQDPPLDVLAKAISNMSHLTSLDLFLNAEPSSSSWILDPNAQQTTKKLTGSIQYGRIQHLACSFGLDSHVAAFLCSTPNLTHLELSPSSGASSVSPSIAATTPSHPLLPVSLPATSVNRLSQFSGSTHEAAILVPGRPLEALFLRSGLIDAETTTALSLSTSQLRILEVQSDLQPFNTLDILHPSISDDLVYLRMETSYLWEKAPGTEFYEHMASALDRFPKLEAFELCGMHWGSTTNQVDALNKRRVWQNAPIAASSPTATSTVTSSNSNSSNSAPASTVTTTDSDTDSIHILSSSVVAAANVAVPEPGFESGPPVSDHELQLLHSSDILEADADDDFHSALFLGY